MAQSIPKRCTRCSQMATKGGRCDDHQVKPWANASANTQALTGRQRSRLRERIIARDGECAVCGSVNDLEVDHIIEVTDGGALEDESNLQLLCVRHHEEKSKQAKAARRSRPKVYTVVRKRQ